MMNKVILLGNLTRDVELTYTQGGLAIGKFGLAVNRKLKDKVTGETKEEVMFIDVALFGRTAEIASQYLSKGKRVLIEGRLTLEQWEDKSSGAKRSKHTVTADSVQFIDRKEDGEAVQRAKVAPKAPAKQAPQIDIDNEDIPF